jgi:FKBP-type peptidyl-prolyl cis-trans isomerase FkpA
MRKWTISMCAAFVFLALGPMAWTQTPAPAPAATGGLLKTDQDRTLYSLGLLLSRNLQSFSLTPQELALVTAGLQDGARGKPLVSNPESYGPKLQQLEQTRRAAFAEGEKKRGAEYLVKAAAAKGATRTASGIIMTTLRASTGASPKATSTVKVHYEGRLINGTVFDSSIKRGEPASFPLSGVIRCWTEGVQLMKVGGKSRLVCPYNLAYGEMGSPPNIPGGATLVFDVELLAIEQP